MTADRNRKLLTLLEDARRLAEQVASNDCADSGDEVERLAAEGRKMQQAAMVLVLAFISDEPTPISLFKPWASYSQFRIWEGEGTLKLTRRNRKVCVTPSAFFAVWRKLKDKRKTKN